MVRCSDPVLASGSSNALSPTMLCSWLSAPLLGGLLVNATVGWWWADPVAALVIAGLAAKEGLEARRGDSYEDACEA